MLVAVLVGLPAFVESLRRRNKEGSGYYTLMCLSNALWAISQALFYLLPDESTALFLASFRLVFVCYSSIFLYLFILKSFKHTLFSKGAILMLYMVPMITAVIAVFDRQLHFLRKASSIEYVDGVRVLVNENGFWFVVHSLVCYVCLMLALSVLITQYRRMHAGYRLSIVIMSVTVVAIGLSTLAAVFGVLPYSLDISPYMVQVAQMVFFYAYFKSHTVDLLFTSRQAVFENSIHPIFILNADGRVIDYNRKAVALGIEAGVDELYNAPYSEVQNRWIEKYDGRFFENNHTIVTLTQDDADEHYEICRSDLLDKSGKVTGANVEIKNITPMMLLVHQLQDSAYFDQLTGLMNRRSMQRELELLDRPENWPLGIVMGDVNRLKQVNDTYGHSVGDLLLKEVVGVLMTNAPVGMRWFRVGGDEFVGLCANATETDLLQTLIRIEAACSRFEDERFDGVGIALGYRIKTSAGQDVMALLHEADIEMYSNKWDRRKK